MEEDIQGNVTQVIGYRKPASLIIREISQRERGSSSAKLLWSLKAKKVLVVPISGLSHQLQEGLVQVAANDCKAL